MMDSNDNEMSAAADARLSEHADRLRQMDDRLNIHDLGLVVMGNKDLSVKGLVERTGAVEKILEDILQWRRDMTIYARAGLAILSVTGLGTWWPYIQQFLHTVMGIK